MHGGFLPLVFHVTTDALSAHFEAELGSHVYSLFRPLPEPAAPCANKGLEGVFTSLELLMIIVLVLPVTDDNDPSAVSRKLSA